MTKSLFPCLVLSLIKYMFMLFLLNPSLIYSCLDFNCVLHLLALLQNCHVKNKDIRKFVDGAYDSEKGTTTNTKLRFYSIYLFLNYYYYKNYQGFYNLGLFCTCYLLINYITCYIQDNAPTRKNKTSTRELHINLSFDILEMLTTTPKCILF